MLCISCVLAPIYHNFHIIHNYHEKLRARDFRLRITLGAGESQHDDLGRVAGGDQAVEGGIVGASQGLPLSLLASPVRK